MLTPTMLGIHFCAAPACGWVVLVLFVAAAFEGCSPPFSGAPDQVKKSGACGSIELASPLEVRRRKSTNQSDKDTWDLYRLANSLRNVPSTHEIATRVRNESSTQLGYYAELSFSGAQQGADYRPQCFQLASKVSTPTGGTSCSSTELIFRQYDPTGRSHPLPLYLDGRYRLRISQRCSGTPIEKDERVSCDSLNSVNGELPAGTVGLSNNDAQWQIDQTITVNYLRFCRGESGGVLDNPNASMRHLAAKFKAGGVGVAKLSAQLATTRNQNSLAQALFRAEGLSTTSPGEKLEIDHVRQCLASTYNQSLVRVRAGSFFAVIPSSYSFETITAKRYHVDEVPYLFGVWAKHGGTELCDGPSKHLGNGSYECLAERSIVTERGEIALIGGGKNKISRGVHRTAERGRNDRTRGYLRLRFSLIHWPEGWLGALP